MHNKELDFYAFTLQLLYISTNVFLFKQDTYQ